MDRVMYPVASAELVFRELYFQRNPVTLMHAVTLLIMQTSIRDLRGG